jgi:4-hydroxy-3-methylbut-2-enyl diphosphate reductase
VRLSASASRDMQQWVADKLLRTLGDPAESYRVGDVVQFPTPDGQGSYAGAVVQVGDASGGQAVLFDFNHPLAGQPVVFEVHVIGVPMKPAPSLLEIMLAEPRGFCAGVDRAIEIVERALQKFGAPIYVRHEIVHNTYVVNDLKAKGAIFIEDLDDVPAGATLVFSAHGVSRAVHDEARARGFAIFDATCPLVTKVHVEVAKLAKEGYEFIMIGHKGHPEVEGTMGQLDGGIHLVEGVDDVARVRPAQSEKLAVVTQTTLSVDDASQIAAAIRARFPQVREPKQQDICYATQNRQDAVKLLSPQVDMVIVVGSPTSSNSNRLREVARKLGTDSYMVDTAEELQARMVRGLSAGRPYRRRVGAGSPGAPGDRSHQGTGRGVGAQARRHRGNDQVPAAQGAQDLALSHARRRAGNPGPH